jgi:precorrin-3B C17-methyltransferase
MKIVMQHRPAATPAGILSQAATANERVWITALGEITKSSLPLDSLIIIGNSQTCVLNGRMVTPRNYIPGTGY